jgi:RNA polymerase sigma factor (sigma-70 family)
MTQPTIFIVDDDPAMRDSLSWLIETIGYPVKVFSSAQEFLDAYRPDYPGCLILDVRLPGMSGIQLQQKMKGDGIHLPVIIISGHGDVPMAVKAMQQGAMVFLEKPFRDQELLDNIQEALVVDEQNRKRDAISSEVQSCVDSLTQREKEVMGLMVKGNPSKEIARHCGISVKTIEIHRARVMEKMKAASLPELVHMILNLQAG